MADPVTEFERYRDELLAALGDDDPIQVLHRSLEEIPRALASAKPEDVARQPAPREWSAAEVLSHLADSDLVAAVRIRMIVTQDRPTLVGYDQEAWTARFASLDADPLLTLERWRSLRQSNVHLYESLTDAEWQRVGVHTERGEESVLLLVRLLAGHDRIHLDQFSRALAKSANAVTA
jgi:DinB superfamily